MLTGSQQLGLRSQVSQSLAGSVGLLEASYIVFLLPPHPVNFGKQFTKSPKLYFVGTGLAAWLAGVRSVQELAISSLRGLLFETWAVGEVLKINHHLRLDARLFFWRDKIGSEVDLLIEHGQQLQTVEFKAGQTVAGDWFAAMRKYESLRNAGGSPASSAAQVVSQPGPVLVYGGSDAQTRDVADICPWQQWPDKAIKLLQ